LVIVFVLILAGVAMSVPIPSHAMIVSANGTPVGTSIPCPASDTPPGVTATCVSLDGVTTADGFSFATCDGCLGPARAVISQSGSILQINVTAITIKAAAPATLRLAVQSGEGEFPFFQTSCPSPGCPAGTAALGFFTPGGASPVGDSLQVTAIATGKTINGQAVSQIPVSLPSVCAGSGVGCTFLPDDFSATFVDDITEAVACGGEVGCAPTITGTLNAAFVNPGEAVTLPASWSIAQLTPDGASLPNAPAILSGALLSPLGVSARLQVKPRSFDLDSVLNLDAQSRGIEPLQFVHFTIGDPQDPENAYSATIPADKFTARTDDGVSFHFFRGKVKGVRLKVVIIPLADNAVRFAVDAKGVNLTGAANPVPVDVAINDNHGSTKVRARITRGHVERDRDEDEEDD